MKTAIVILNWNTKNYLEQFLPGLIASTSGHDAEVIVADSASTDASVEMLSEKFPQVRCIQLEQNYGFTGGYNRALAQVDAQYYILINSDIEVSSQWLTPLENWMDSHKECGACGPKLLSWYDRSSFEYAGAAGGFIDSFGYPFCRGRVMKRVEKDRGQYDTPSDVFWVTGACLMIRSSLWKEMGGLDDRFFAHMEEIDLCWRLQLAGYRVQVVPESVVYHLGGGTLPNDSAWKLELNYRNNLLLLQNNLAKTYALQCGDAAKAIRRAKRRIFMRMVMDGMSWAVYLVTGKPGFAKAVVAGHNGWRSLGREPARIEVESYLKEMGGKAQVRGIWNKWMVPWAFLKGENIFDYIRENLQ